ncbi:MAG: tetraacyldisaccharide 4'-kinase [bacterium]
MSASGKIARALEGAPDAPLWMRGALTAISPAGWAYGAAMGLRRSLYETVWGVSEAPSCPIISVGNITLGGTGKSPAVAWVVARLIESGRRPAVVSRGYGGSLIDVSAVSDGAGEVLSSPPASDEAVMLARMFPSVAVITGRDRPAAARRAAAEYGAEIIVVDDGFQHLALRRDLDLVVLRGERPFGNGRVFPAGALREPLGALRRAEAVLLTGDVRPETRAMVQRAAPRAAVFSGSLRPAALMDAAGRTAGVPGDLKGAAVIAVSGIGHPEAFSRTLEELGVRILVHHAYPDHAAYPPDVVASFFDSQKETGADFIITTEKDIVKMAPPAEDSRLRALRVEMEIEGGEDLASLIMKTAQVNSAG